MRLLALWLLFAYLDPGGQRVRLSRHGVSVLVKTDAVAGRDAGASYREFARLATTELARRQLQRCCIVTSGIDHWLPSDIGPLTDVEISGADAMSAVMASMMNIPKSQLPSSEVMVYTQRHG